MLGSAQESKVTIPWAGSPSHGFLPMPALTVLLTFRPWVLVGVLIDFFITCFGCCFVSARMSFRSTHWWIRDRNGFFEKIWNVLSGARRAGVSPAMGGPPSQRVEISDSHFHFTCCGPECRAPRRLNQKP